MQRLRVTGLTHIYPGTKRPALRDVSFDAPARRTLAIVGPSGAGKSTLLRIVSGLLRPSAGSVSTGERNIDSLPPNERRIALVFQRDALFANMSVRENLRFGMRGRAAHSEVAAMAERFGVAAYLERMPPTLSGGERQRVALARALLSRPAALLLDEPLAHLDPELRARLRAELSRAREVFEGPVVYVTHDHAEALALGDELLVLIDGAVEDRGEPQRVYDAPRTLRAARFFGERPMNLLAGTRAGVVTGIRPERVRVDPAGPIVGTVLRRERSGPDAYLYVQTQGGTVTARISPLDDFAVGDALNLAFDVRYVREFDAVSGVARE